MRITVNPKKECSSAATLGAIPTGGSKSTTNESTDGKELLSRSMTIKDLFGRLEKQGIFENDDVTYEVVEIPYSCQLVIHREDIETAYIEDSGSQGDAYKITIYDEDDEELDDKYCEYADEAVEYILDWLGGDLNP